MGLADVFVPTGSRVPRTRPEKFYSAAHREENSMRREKNLDEGEASLELAAARITEMLRLRSA
jgi:hypothetical protein